MNSKCFYRHIGTFLRKLHAGATICLAFLLCMFGSCFWLRSYAETAAVEIVIPYKQVWTTDDDSVDDTFYYLMTPDEETPLAPLPAGASDGVYRWAVKGNATGNLKISYPNSGVYKYNVSPVVEGKLGYTYGAGTYQIGVYIAWNESSSTLDGGTITLLQDGYGKVPVLALDPSYKSSKKNTSTGSTETAEPTAKPAAKTLSAATKPRTGDEVPYALLVALCMVSFILLPVIHCKRRNSQENEEEGGTG